MTGLTDSAGALPASLRPYQWQGVHFLASRDSALLADEMGLGKTVQAAVALSTLFAEGHASRAMVVVPASLRLNWSHELSRWAQRLTVRIVHGGAKDRLATYWLPVNVIVASYEHVRTDALEIAKRVDLDIVLLDEAQRIKNAGSDTALACRLLKRRRSWALTGTPVENSVDDLSSVFQFLRPGLLRAGMSRPAIHDAMHQFFLRRRKTDVLPELPSITIQDLPLEIEGSQREAYEALWLQREDLRGGEAQTSALLGLITKLKQICNFEPITGESVKLDALRLILDNATTPEDRVIVFSQFVETLRWLAPRLDRDLVVEMLHGGVQEAERQDMISRFNNDPGPRVLLVSLRAGGVGLNMQAASAVVMFDRWWNPAVEDQAIHRAHRFGRKSNLLVYRFIVVDSIEERIAEILANKRDIFDEYVEGATSASTTAFTKDELLRILRLN